MRRITTTKQLNSAITNNLLNITKAEIYYSITRLLEIPKPWISNHLKRVSVSSVNLEYFQMRLDGIMREFKTNGYICEVGRMNPDSEVIISVYLRVCEGVRGEDIDEVLRIMEEEWAW